jgi:hypothetical protein
MYRRCPKTGGTFVDFATVNVAFTDDLRVEKGDALYGVDELGNLHRIRSATDQTVIARFTPDEAAVLGTDGTSVYVATGSPGSGALFRILE